MTGAADRANGLRINNMVDRIRSAAQARNARFASDLSRRLLATGENAALRDSVRVALAHLFRTFGETDRQRPKRIGRIVRPEVRGLPIARLRKVMAYIDASLGERLDVATLAAVASMSPGYFTAMFKRATGVTPHEAVTRRRLTRSQELLTDESLTVAEIGYQLGFSSHAHFCTAFRRRIGLSPTAWRAQRRGPAINHRGDLGFSTSTQSSSQDSESHDGA